MNKNKKKLAALDVLREADYKLDDAQALFNRTNVLAAAATLAYRAAKDYCIASDELTAKQICMQETKLAKDEAVASYRKAREARNVAYNQWLKANGEQLDDGSSEF